MKILNKAELQQAEKVLRSHFPKSSMAYGYLFAMNRDKPHILEVVVDSWPDFKTIICRPHPQSEHTLLHNEGLTFFSTDEKVLKRMLTEDSILDCKKYFKIRGIDMLHTTMLKDISATKDVTMRSCHVTHLLELQDPNHLPHLTVSRDVEARISSLNEFHVGLVNETWKRGDDEKGFQRIKHLISHFPTCCITDEEGRSVSWVLLYDYCAMGLLYTLPEHRGKGYAKILLSTMAARLHAQGYPVYCYVLEENQVSYRLFKKLGFTEYLSFRATRFEFNY
ncbi:glycine N-acyltransferase-like protein 3 [Conger conger]|uniref:glycine N-acyltransferase-like protein 3 n=1 Tax=Conger conger TaxID=82655 RepID=UPI002A5A48DC|nr:glycine N-acyltransferase-like protein 3 [Conger conger]XP_061084239.1 glycine N-acyltransferase-like protein 3 [Conger conger]XP_061084240.1 glycine N-acyltransferase-like protein 3 [Conger conger]